VKLAYLRAVFIHPLNSTYPIFSIVVQTTEAGYAKKIDCDRVNVNIQNLQVFDNTCYPNSLDPEEVYAADVAVIDREILGVNTGEVVEEQMLDLELFVFAYPGPDGGCEH
jgi:hypothetical protein